VISCFPTPWHAKVTPRWGPRSQSDVSNVPPSHPSLPRSDVSNFSRPRLTPSTQFVQLNPNVPSNPVSPQPSRTSLFGITPLQGGRFDAPDDHSPIENIPAAMHGALQDNAFEGENLQFAAEGDPLDVMKRLFRLLKPVRREAITSARELACLITTVCVNVFDSQEIPDEFHFFDFFEQSIGAVVRSHFIPS
jgi:hypothetical protein